MRVCGWRSCLRDVYLSEDGRFVFKVNDAGYYATWTEYFNSLLLHNLLFSHSAYTFLGFIEIDETPGVEFPLIQPDLKKS